MIPYFYTIGFHTYLQGIFTISPDKPHLLWLIVIPTVFFHLILSCLTHSVCLSVSMSLHQFLTSPVSEQMSNDIMRKNVFILTMSLKFKWEDAVRLFFHLTNAEVFLLVSELSKAKHLQDISLYFSYSTIKLLICLWGNRRQALCPKCHRIASVWNDRMT